MPLKEKDFIGSNIQVLQLPYFINYNPQTNFYFAKEKTNFEVNPHGRSEGTYTKYASLDDKIDGFIIILGSLKQEEVEQQRMLL